MRYRVLGQFAPLALVSSMVLAPVMGLAQDLPSLSGMVPTETVCKDVAGFPASALTDGDLETLWQTNREIAPCHFVFRFDEPVAVAAVILHNASGEGGRPPTVRATIWASHQGFGRGYFRVAHDALESTGPTRITFDEPILMRTLKVALENAEPFSSRRFNASLAEIEMETVATNTASRWPMPRLAPLIGGNPIAKGAATQCDEYAAFPYNPDSYGYGREAADLDVNEALVACRTAVAENPQSQRLAFQLARVEAHAEQSVQSVARLGSALLRAYPPAQYLLAEALRTGTGIAQDDDRHLNLHQSAADAGFLPSRMRLAKAADETFLDALISGEQQPAGVAEPLEPNLAALIDVGYLPAYGLYSNYIQRTDTSSLMALMPRLEELAEYNRRGSLFSRLYNEQYGIPAARRRAMRWVTENAAKTQSPVFLGTLSLGYRYVYSDHNASVLAARKGAYSGDGWPVQQLAERLGGGATQRLFAFAFQRTLSAAEDGERNSMFDLGKAYIEGKGVEKNREEGARWMRLAAVAGELRSIAYVRKNSWVRDTGATRQ